MGNKLYTVDVEATIYVVATSEGHARRVANQAIGSHADDMALRANVRWLAKAGQIDADWVHALPFVDEWADEPVPEQTCSEWVEPPPAVPCEPREGR